MRISDWSSDVCSSDLFGGMDRTNARMLNSLRSPCQGVPVWRKLEATRGGRIEKLNAELCARGGERWLPTFIIATMRFRHQMCGDVGPSARCGYDRPPSRRSL